MEEDIFVGKFSRTENQIGTVNNVEDDVFNTQRFTPPPLPLPSLLPPTLTINPLSQLIICNTYKLNETQLVSLLESTGLRVCQTILLDSFEMMDHNFWHR